MATPAGCSASRTGEGYWTCDVPGGCTDCRTLASELGDLSVFDEPDEHSEADSSYLAAGDGSAQNFFVNQAL